MKSFPKPSLKKRPGGSLLGLSLDGSRLEGAVVRRTNGSVEITSPFAVSLSLDLLSNDPELVGREIRKQLDAVGVRERACVVCVPLGWALTLTVALPELPEADIASFIQIEAERGFPSGPETLMLAYSRYRLPEGAAHATLVGIPRDHVTRLDAVLRAARLRPASFSLGIAALQRGDAEPDAGVLALAPVENGVCLQVTCGGGLAALRRVDGAADLEGGERTIQADQIARETRITLGQLSAGLSDRVREARVYGRSDTALNLTRDLEPRLVAMGLDVRSVRDYAAVESGVKVPAGTAVSPAVSLAISRLAGQKTELEFLPPRVSAWSRFNARHSSRKLVWAGTAVGAVALVVALAFLIQQWQLSRWDSRWMKMKPRVTELEAMQQQIRRFRPWYDESYRSLSILRRLSEALPQDGSVSAKTVEIREPATVTCSGTAKDNPSLLKALDQLGKVREIADVRVESIRGKSPLEFTLNFHWGETTSP